MSNPTDPSEPVSPEPPPACGIGKLDAAELLARALHTAQPSAGATAWTPPAPQELARLLPQYAIESLIGQGGMGAVYKGRQPALDRPVAIKLLPAEVAADEQFIARFRREARTLAKLQHPSIVAVHDFGQTGEGHLYFVMEYVDGTDLRQILSGPGLNPAQALELISQVCEALHYAHGRDVIHRDIKPGNILVTAEGRAKLADFGLARPIKEQTSILTGANTVMGTADYMAPEQRDGHADQRADIYALGVMLYEMLTGQRPHGVFDPPSHRVVVDIRLDEVVLKAMQQEPARRYQQVSEMKTDVDTIRTTPLPAAKKKEVALPSRKTLWLGGAFLVAVCAVLAGILLWKKGQPFRQEADPKVASLRVATKENPFVNSLGMKFVPVPGTQVLFCTTETTKGQYRQYANSDAGASKVFEHVEREGILVSPEDSHPVVMVTWEDANAFCAWLSKNEGHTYRLPTDHEWSCAVGIGSREDPNALPETKIYSVSEVFPWGGGYPPQGAPVGNYLDSTAIGKFRDLKPLENYRDGFITTAPVGSFPYNDLGIYDLGGNADEWCMDWHDPVKKRSRVGRGGNWNVSDKYNLSSSARSPSGISNRWDGTGFRAVLVLPEFAPSSPFTAKIPNLPPDHADYQRKLAESVLSKGGSVILWREFDSLLVERIEKLPPGPLSLRHIDQVNGDFSDDDAALLESCRELSGLRIHRGSLTRIPFDSLPDLKRFEVSECCLTLSSLRGLAGKLKLNQVLIGNTPVGGEIIGVLANCPMLEHLSLNTIGMKNSDLESLTHMPRLKYLWIGGDPLTEEGLVVITRIPLLESLTLYDPDGRMSNLAFLPKMPGLSNFILYRCAISPGIFRNVAAMPGLKSLSVIEGSIAEGALRALAGSDSLRSLNLQGITVTEACFAELTSLTMLEELDVLATDITDAGATALRQALPNCNVRRSAAQR